VNRGTALHILTLSLGGGEWSASCPGLYPHGKSPITQWIGMKIYISLKSLTSVFFGTMLISLKVKLVTDVIPSVDPFWGKDFIMVYK